MEHALAAGQERSQELAQRGEAEQLADQSTRRFEDLAKKTGRDCWSRVSTRAGETIETVTAVSRGECIARAG